MTVYLINLTQVPIFKQLQLEEALLRVDTRNFVILNHNAPRAIVLGISGKQDELVDLQKAKEDKIPLIRRFSGGGTVITDPSTLFVSFIYNHSLLDISPFPDSILRWSADFYKSALNIEGFALKEHDYAIGNFKCAGNAQYLRKERFVHHSTFLWDFDNNNMSYLLQPKKMPSYRENRSHLDFLCKLKPYHPCIDLLKKQIIAHLCSNYSVQQLSFEQVQHVLSVPHRKTTTELMF